ncbi:MAG: aminotransferase class I/II-fold pyridoxal phosphate-dependent enzyme [Desulfurococcales archaeon]|nr:aminotransferase class I/II-fold pyridoxal phosphate-dependent enzyme [Desulfurococcales archaeon]
MSDVRGRGFSTRSVWGSWYPGEDEKYEPIIPPIYVSTVFRHPPGIGRLLPRLGDLKYSRENNPTVMLLEATLCGLEEASWCLCFNSGMAALSSVLFSFLYSGRTRRVTVMRLVYAPTRLLVERVASMSGASYNVAGPPWDELLEAASRSDVIIVETMANPTLRVPPLRELYGLCRESGCKVVVDNTFASPAIYRPVSEGGHVVVESLTKYIVGHNDAIGGLVATNSREIAEETYTWRSLLGGIARPIDAYLTLRGLKTLKLRMERVSRTAKEVAEWLEDHPKVSRVYYPGLPSHPDHETARSLFNGMYGGVVSFEVKDGQEGALRVIDRVKTIVPSPSFGATESLLSYPEWSSHRELPENERRSLGITPGLLRLSVGLEDPEDLIEDLSQALGG